MSVLRSGEQCVCHLESVLGYRQAYISQQLMTLREAGLVADRREGANVFYRVVQPALFSVIEAGLKLEGHSLPAARTAAAQACPCPKCQPAAQPGR